MDKRITAIYQRMVDLEDELETEINQARENLAYTIEKKRIRFEKKITAYHRKFKKKYRSYVVEARVLHFLTAPVIYGLFVPLVLLDLAVTIYQFICFPVYGIKKVPRGDFIVVDRHHLAYLNAFEKFNCVYCGYGNGLANYVREIAARTENYWCPIKHARKITKPHSQYHKFEEYGDAESFRARMEKYSDAKKK